MMPFSPLRTWGLGLFSWILLGIGIYCIWKWADPPTRLVVTDRVEVEPDAPPRRPPAVQEVETSVSPLYLLAGIALVAFSSAGFLPMTLFLGRPGKSHGGDVPHDTMSIKRPDGTKLHVKIFGRSDGPTLVLTHGWSLDTSCWQDQLPLAERFRIIAWDLPGLGKSKGPDNRDYSIEKMAQDLKAVVDVAGEGAIVLLGHSIGGMITQTFCRLYPERLGDQVDGIVLLHTTYTNPLRTALLASLWTAIEKPVLVPLNYLTMGLAPLAWLSNWQGYLNGTLHIATRFTSFAGHQTWGQIHHGAWHFVKAWPGVVARGNLAMLEFDELETLSKIEIPALVIAAEHDRLTKPEASARIEEVLPQGRLATVESGHLGFREQSLAVNQLITEFMEQVWDSDCETTVANAEPPIASAPTSE